MSATPSIGVGIIGMGFMGRTHLAAYAAANAAGEANELLAVCEQNPERRRGQGGATGNLASPGLAGPAFDPNHVQCYSDLAEFLAHPELDLVSICTPTDSHVELALAALAAGKHVLVEKPVATDAGQIERLLVAARASKQRCMPAHCMRFWPAWSWLHDVIRSAEFGRVRSAVFRRLAPVPDWSPGFYKDPKRTGGALVDLHIHDADFISWCFGQPDEVISTGSPAHLTTLYRYAEGPEHVLAEGGWEDSPGFEFQMCYRIHFERATLEFELGRDPELTLSREGQSQAVELCAGDGYLGEVRHLLQAIHQERTELRVSLEDALSVAHLLERERESLRSAQEG